MYDLHQKMETEETIRTKLTELESTRSQLVAERDEMTQEVGRSSPTEANILRAVLKLLTSLSWSFVLCQLSFKIAISRYLGGFCLVVAVKRIRFLKNSSALAPFTVHY